MLSSPEAIITFFLFLAITGLADSNQHDQYQVMFAGVAGLTSNKPIHPKSVNSV